MSSSLLQYEGHEQHIGDEYFYIQCLPFPTRTIQETGRLTFTTHYRLSTAHLG